MKVVIDPSEQLRFKPINPSIKDELERREGNKEYVYNRTPFVRVSCLQEVAYTDEELNGKANNLRETKDSVLVDNTRFNGFQFIFDSNFDESYGEVQKIGKTLDEVDVRIKNPRRVPPPSLDSFTATVGDSSDYFTTAQLSFTCNSLEQLQFLVPFLFNPGNTIFVEFGHNTEQLKNNISFFDSDDAEKLVQSTVIDLRRNTTCDEGFIERMNKRIFDSGGAYDFFYGIVNNFDFSLNESLGYDCTVDLIATSKAKLNDPNIDNYTDQNKPSDEVIARTLDSKLKGFEDRLSLANEELDRDIIFSFTDDDSETYVRLDTILAFLDGRFDNLDEDNAASIANQSGFSFEPELQTARRSSTFVDTEIPFQSVAFYDSILYDWEDKLEVRKADIKNGEPPIVSYSNDLLLFRRNMWNPQIDYNNNNYTYSIRVDDDNFLNNYVNGETYLGNYNVKETGTETGISKLTTNFNIIKPYLVDIPDNDGFEDLHHSYIKYDKFYSIYKASNGKRLDTLKKLQNLINDATNDQWQIQFVGDSVDRRDGERRNENTRCEKVKSRIISVSSFGVDDTSETYVFKANSKESVFNSMDYGLGLDGILGDQIYMNALNSSDGSMDSKKLNLLLFSNHENNLKITDKRNARISSLRKDEDNNGGGGSVTKPQNITPSTLRTNFYAKNTVGNNGTGTIPTYTATSASNFVSSLTDRGALKSDNPLEVKIEDFQQAIIPFVPATSTNDGGLVRRVRRFSDKEIKDSIFQLYDIKPVPLVFSPIKQAVEKLRANKDSFIQPQGEKKSQEQPRKRSYREGGVSPLLESTLDITMTGVGGINPLEYVGVSGIPDVYANRGHFCVMNVTHTITPNNWETQISTRFRPKYEDER